MALKATIYKAELAIADMTRHYYQTHSLTLAQHPSETVERMMLRLVAFALCAHERLQFGKGISEDSEPDLWQHDYSGDIALWIELGLPDDKLLRRAAHRAIARRSAKALCVDADRSCAAGRYLTAVGDRRVAPDAGRAAAAAAARQEPAAAIAALAARTGDQNAVAA